MCGSQHGDGWNAIRHHPWLIAIDTLGRSLYYMAPHLILLLVLGLPPSSKGLVLAILFWNACHKLVLPIILFRGYSRSTASRPCASQTCNLGRGFGIYVHVISAPQCRCSACNDRNSSLQVAVPLLEMGAKHICICTYILLMYEFALYVSRCTFKE